MGEELVVYRDRSGTLGVVDKYCAHRRASLAYGVVEEDGIRCQYHGWKYDATGACIEQPFEDTTHPEDNFQAKCSITAYKVQELAGLVFCYMGPDPAPLLPRWGSLVWENCVRDIAITILPCNWVQCQENSTDSTHNEHLHDYAGNYFREIMAGKEPTFKRTRRHLKIGYDLYKYGIIKRRTTEDRDENHPRWAHRPLDPLPQHPLAQRDDAVPRADRRREHAAHLDLPLAAAPGTEAPKQDVVPVALRAAAGRERPLQRPRPALQPGLPLLEQPGPHRRQRDLEKLGAGDTGVIKFRSLLISQMRMVQDGGEPSMNVFRDEEENNGLEWPVIPHESKEWVGAAYSSSGTYRYRPSESGYSADADKIEETMRTWAGADIPSLREAGFDR